MAVMNTEHISISISCSFETTYNFLSHPGNFTKWASGLGKLFQGEGELWHAETPMGVMKMRFTPSNAFGIVDHTLITKEGTEMYNPMRVIQNADGCDVVFTLFQRPEMSDQDFQKDADWVKRDLIVLKDLLERIS